MENVDSGYTKDEKISSEAALAKYPGILQIRAKMRMDGIPDLVIIHKVVKTTISSPIAGHTSHFSFEVSEIDSSKGTASISINITENGIDSLAKHIEDFSDTQLKAINEACELEIHDKRQRGSWIE